MSIDLPTLFAEVAKLKPELRESIDRDYLNRGWQGDGISCSCEAPNHAQWVPDSLAETIIIGACVRLLGKHGPDSPWAHPCVYEWPDGSWEADCGNGKSTHGDSPAIALLLAVKAQAKGTQ